MRPTCSAPHLQLPSPCRSEPQPPASGAMWRISAAERSTKSSFPPLGSGAAGPERAPYPAQHGSDPHVFHLAPTPPDPSRGGRPRGGRCCLIRPRGNNQTQPPPPSPSPPPPPRLPGHLQNPGWVPASGSPRGRCLPARSDGGGGARGRRGRRATGPPVRLCPSGRSLPAPPRAAQRPRPPSPR